MGPGVLSFAAGTVLLAQSPSLPDGCLVQLLPLAAVLALASPRARLPALLACGYLWALLRAQCIAVAALPPSLDGRDLLIEGYVTGIPATSETRTRFELQTVSARRASARAGPHASVGFHGRVRVSWYGAAVPPRAGERWRLRLRLERPRGSLNPGGFDYERWLYLERLAATGYVREDARNARLGSAAPALLDRARQSLAEAITAEVGASETAALLAALAVGDRGAMSRSQWRVLRDTGTAHLMAISGLHVGLVASLAFLGMRRTWALLPPLARRLAAPRAAALAALAASSGYAALAGFTLPTQRALVMLAVLMLALWLRRRVAASARLGSALVAVLVLDPLATLSGGFWLSFVAVAVLLLGMGARVGGGAPARLWRQWGRAQWLVAVGLAPLTVALFLEYPLAAPLANLIAVPWTGLVVVPLLLAGLVLELAVPVLGGALLEAAASALGLLWALLVGIAERVPTLAVGAAPPWPALVAALAGALVMVLPSGIPGRRVAAACLLPLIAWPVPRPPPGAFWLTLLDVGQGLAVVVRTRHHTLVYDAGPRYGGAFDAAGAVIVPFLRHAGRARIDTLVLSHAHADHVGGAATLLASMEVARVLSNVPGYHPRTLPCTAGHRWRWDGVEFRVLHPGAGSRTLDNDGSCVVRVSGRDGARALLPGDLEARGEAALVSRAAHALAAGVLVVAHHGSITSSSEGFLDAVRPTIALLAVGHRNRHGLPDALTLRRLRARGVAIYDTARCGAIELRPDASGALDVHRRERLAARRIWRAADPRATREQVEGAEFPPLC